MTFVEAVFCLPGHACLACRSTFGVIALCGLYVVLVVFSERLVCDMMMHASSFCTNDIGAGFRWSLALDLSWCQSV